MFLRNLLRKADRSDPQQRLLLECAAEALDDAGIAPGSLAGGETAVVIGVSSHNDADSSSVDTACASTLSAVHQACEALRSGRSPSPWPGA